MISEGRLFLIYYLHISPLLQMMRTVSFPGLTSLRPFYIHVNERADRAIRGRSGGAEFAALSLSLSFSHTLSFLFLKRDKAK